MTDMIEELERALEKARDRFTEYADSHQSKAEEAHSYANKAISGDRYSQMRAEAQVRYDKAARNREMADMLDSVISDALPQLLALAKLGRIVREASPETIEAVARLICKASHHDPDRLSAGYVGGKTEDQVAERTRPRWMAYVDAARAVLRTLEGLVK